MKQIWNSFRLAFSMYSIIPARQIDKTKENTKLEITGRHDPCIVPRAVVVVESMAAIGILDMMKDI